MYNVRFPRNGLMCNFTMHASIASKVIYQRLWILRKWCNHIAFVISSLDHIFTMNNFCTKEYYVEGRFLGNNEGVLLNTNSFWPRDLFLRDLNHYLFSSSNFDDNVLNLKLYTAHWGWSQPQLSGASIWGGFFESLKHVKIFYTY